MIPAGADGVETHGATVHDFRRIERRRAMHLAAETELGVFVGARNAGLRFTQARQHLLGVAADG